MNLPECQEQLIMLEPHHRLLHNGDFQAWAKATKKQLDAIELALVKNSWKGKDLLSALEYVGLTAPVTQEDQLRLYIALKAVLGFERRKLSLLEAQSDRYEETKRRILELGRDGDIGINRSVPA